MGGDTMQSYIDELDRSIFNFVEYEGYDDRYPSLSMQSFPPEFYDELRHASRRLFQIFCKAAKVFQMAPDNFARDMDMPENLIPYLHKSNALGLPTWLSRFDFVLDTSGGLRMVELNADTPCFLIESYYANEIAANFVGRDNPNKESREELRLFLKRMYNAVIASKYGKAQYENLLTNGGLPKEPIVFSCFHDYFEDYGTTQFLMKELKAACPNADTRFLSFYDLKIDDDGIPLEDGQHATALYRLHPMELLIDELTPDDEPLGEMFLDLYEDNKFALFNPPEAIILQNKSFMSLVYALYLTEQFYSKPDRDIIERYLTPSYFESDFSSLADGNYIQKEIWGREGRHIQVVQKQGNEAILQMEKLVDNYDDIVCRDSKKIMYQDFIKQKHFTHTVDGGTKEGFLTLSCFMLGDQASAVGCRFSPEEIAGTEAYYVPLVID